LSAAPTSPSCDEPRGRSCVAGDDDDHTAVLRGHQDLTVAEPLDHGALQHDRRTVGRAVVVARGDQRDAVRLPEVDAERLGALHQPGDVGVATEQIVDELGPLRLLPAEHLVPLGLVPVDQPADGVVEHAQHRLSGAADLLRIGGADHYRELAPQASCGGQVEIHRASRADTLRGCAPSEIADGVQFPCVRTPAVDRGVGEQRQVLTEQIRRCLTGLRGRRSDLGQPVIGDRRRRSPAETIALLAAGHGRC
jgi:hypothetical protein